MPVLRQGAPGEMDSSSEQSGEVHLDFFVGLRWCTFAQHGGKMERRHALALVSEAHGLLIQTQTKLRRLPCVLGRLVLLGCVVWSNADGCNTRKLHARTHDTLFSFGLVKYLPQWKLSAAR